MIRENNSQVEPFEKFLSLTNEMTFIPQSAFFLIAMSKNQIVVGGGEEEGKE